MKSGLILLAAGSSSRMGEDKMQRKLLGRTAVFHCLEAAKALEQPFDRIVITTREADEKSREVLKEALKEETNVAIIPGGCTRGGSVYLALKAMEGMDVVLIHDAARCLVSPTLLERCRKSAAEKGSGIAALPSRDSVYHKQDGPVDRESLLLTQTPQAFSYREIRRAYELAAVTGKEATDDCSLYRAMGLEPCFVEGELTNQKLTYASDIPFFEAILRSRA